MLGCVLFPSWLRDVRPAKLLYFTYSRVLSSYSLIYSAWIMRLRYSPFVVATDLGFRETALSLALKCVNTRSGSHDFLTIVQFSKQGNTRLERRKFISRIYTTWMPRRMSISTVIAQHRRAEGQMDGFSSLEPSHFHLAWHQSLWWEQTNTPSAVRSRRLLGTNLILIGEHREPPSLNICSSVIKNVPLWKIVFAYLEVMSYRLSKSLVRNSFVTFSVYWWEPEIQATIFFVYLEWGSWNMEIWPSAMDNVRASVLSKA